MKLITFETAKLAKEKGFGKLKTFHEKLAWYGNVYNSRGTLRCNKIPYDFNSGYSPAPYQYELMDWLRENKLFIFISINDTMEYENIVSYNYTIIQNSKGSSCDYTICSKKDYEDYNECLEEALQEALKLI